MTALRARRIMAAVSTWIRQYISVVVLLVAAAVLLLVSTDSKVSEAAAGGAFALLGGAVTRAVDVAERRRREKEAREAAYQRAIDETRRVGYMALLGGSTGNLEIAATLVNALVHHFGVPEDEAMSHVPTVVNSGDGDYDSARWLRAQLEQIRADTLFET